MLNSQLLIVGDGVLREQLQNKINVLGLQNDVLLIGKVANVSKYLQESDVYVITSKYEGLPLSMLEAISSGLPIISSNVGGIKDVITEGLNGYLYDLNLGKDEIVKKLLYLYNNKDIMSDIRNNNILLSKKYDIEETSSQYCSLYSKN